MSLALGVEASDVKIRAAPTTVNNGVISIMCQYRPVAWGMLLRRAYDMLTVNAYRSDIRCHPRS